MKFRGRIAEGVSIRKFYQLIATISKIGKACILRLTAGRNICRCYALFLFSFSSSAVLLIRM
jgi:hypothetical protein